MKKFIALAVLLPGIILAREYKYSGPLGPGDSSNADITISAPGTGKRNCLDFVVFNSTASSSLASSTASYYILSNQTTNYMVTVTTITPPVVMPFTKETPWCGEQNESVTLRSNGRGYEINYKGFVQDMREFESR